jgi:pimeloyl-ACP methyl ester carboxylesterase
MATVKSMGVTIDYMQEGKGRDVLFLHGWGQNQSMMEPLHKHMLDRFRVTTLDLPGFGKSGLPDQPWGVDEYTTCLEEFIRQTGIVDPILVAHSFGARVAIRYASRNKVHKMVLTGAAGLKPKRGIDYHAKVTAYKVAKQLFKLPFLKPYQEKMRGYFGSSDYKNASGILRASFVKIVNQDLRPYLKTITCPVLLVWGEKDDATPLWMGKVMEKEFKDAGLVVFENDDHFAYWHQLDRFQRIIDTFLKEDEEQL